ESLLMDVSQRAHGTSYATTTVRRPLLHRQQRAAADAIGDELGRGQRQAHAPARSHLADRPDQVCTEALVALDRSQQRAVAAPESMSQRSSDRSARRSLAIL